MDNPKNFVKLQSEELNITDIIQLVTFPNCGAVSTFIGITRDNFEDKQVEKLEYEVYETMALKQMSLICDEIRSQWNVEGIAIYHRIGEVPISKASVAIAISSPHRAESLKAVEFAINTLKATVPIWKKEVYKTGESQWKENKECKWANKSSNDSETNTVGKSTTQRDENAQATSDEETSEQIFMDSHSVQIQANEEEMSRRISKFISKKRQQIDARNVREFCGREPGEEKEDSCARIDATFTRRRDSKSHMKIYRVYNAWGPQIIDQLVSSAKAKKQKSDDTDANANCSSAVNERTSTAERKLGIKPVPKDVYKRLKDIEDRLLYLEGITPEYFIDLDEFI